MISPFIFLGAAVSRQEQNATTGHGPTVISVAAVVYDRIAINIPGAFVSVVAEIEARIEKQQTMPDSAPIIFTAHINSHGQQPIITIPPESITAMEKDSTYLIKVSDHVLSALNDDHTNKQYTMYNRSNLFSTTNPEVHTDFLSYFNSMVS